MKTEFRVVGKEPEPESHRLCRRPDRPRRPSARGTVAVPIFTGIPIDPEYNLP